MVKEGTLWTDNHGKNFRVLHLVEQDDQTWVHYREDFGIKLPALECKEYSCYVESFEQRFRQLP